PLFPYTTLFRSEHQALALRIRSAHRDVALPVAAEVELRAREQAFVVVPAAGAAEHVRVTGGRAQQHADARDGRVAEEAEHAGAAVLDLVHAAVHVEREARRVTEVVEAECPHAAFLLLVLGAPVAAAVDAVEAQAEPLLRAEALAQVGMDLRVRIARIARRQ